MITREQLIFRATLAKLLVFLTLCGVVGAMIISVLLGPQVGVTDTYRAKFADVTALKAGDEVRVSGVIVGTVSNVELVRANDVVVTFAVNRNQQITTSTNAVVRFANLLGQRFLALTQVGSPGAVMKPGSTIPDNRTAPALSLTALFNGFQPLFASLSPRDVNRLTEQVVQMLQGQGGTIHELFAETAKLTTNLAARDDAFKAVIDSFSDLAGVVAKHDSELSTMLDSLNRLSGQLAADSPAINQSLLAVGGLTSSVRALLGGIQDQPTVAITKNLADLAATVASNRAQLDATMKAFPIAYGTFDRLTQNGNWLNAFPCHVSAVILGKPTVTAAQITDLIAAYGGVNSGVASTVASLVTGLVPVKGEIPLNIPVGPIGRSDSNTPVCR